MGIRSGAVGLALLVAPFAASSAWAQAGSDRPSEQDLFGGGSTPPAAPAAKPAAPPAAAPAADVPAPPAPAAAAAGAPAGGGTERDQNLLGTGSDAKFLADYVAPENPLQIGGQLYLRAQSTASGGQTPSAWSMA